MAIFSSIQSTLMIITTITGIFFKKKAYSTLLGQQKSNPSTAADTTDQPDFVKIKIRFPSRICILSVSPYTPLSQIYQENFKIELSQYHVSLVYNGFQLMSTNTLAAYDIRNGAILQGNLIPLPRYSRWVHKVLGTFMTTGGILFISWVVRITFGQAFTLVGTVFLTFLTYFWFYCFNRFGKENTITNFINAYSVGTDLDSFLVNIKLLFSLNLI